MKTLSKLLTVELWKTLSDPLFCGCWEFLWEDMSADNDSPEYLRRKSPRVIRACASQLYKFDDEVNSTESILRVMNTGVLPSNPRLGQFLKTQEASGLAVSVLCARPSTIKEGETIAIVAFLKRLQCDVSPINWLIGMFDSYSTWAPDSCSVAVESTFWDKVWSTIEVNTDLVLNVLKLVGGYASDFQSTGRLSCAIDDDLAARFMVLSVSQQRTVLEAFCANTKVQVHRVVFDELLTAVESV